MRVILRIGAGRFPTRGAIFFLIAIVLPCAVLAGLTLLMMAQQRELAENRRADARRALTAAVRSELLSQLERVKRQALTGGRASDTAPVALVARLENGRMLLPWEPDPEAPGADLPTSGAFADAMRTGERTEQVRERMDEAIAAFRTALGASASPSQAAFARLALSRVLAASGRTREAALEDRHILRAGLDVRDDQGIPFALYGAHRQLSQEATLNPTTASWSRRSQVALWPILHRRPPRSTCCAMSRHS